MATLVVTYHPEGPQIGRAFRLPFHGGIVGRGHGCAVHVESGFISRQHAHIYFNGDSWVIEDLQSMNGCWVNDMPVVMSRLRDQDTLMIGKVIFKFTTADAFRIPSRADDGEGGGGAPALLGIPKPRLPN